MSCLACPTYLTYLHGRLQGMKPYVHLDIINNILETILERLLEPITKDSLWHLPMPEAQYHPFVTKQATSQVVQFKLLSKRAYIPH